MSSHSENRYKADLREMRFLLLEQFRLGELLSKAPFEAFGLDEVNMVLDEAYRFACDVFGPLHASGDREGCRLVDGGVVTPEGFKAAWSKLYEAGWKSLCVPAADGGQGAPFTVGVLVEEMLAGANPALSMYPGLTQGATEVIAHFGTPRQRELYLPPMHGGTWSGTMCLTEAQAGSDVGACRTTATKLPDGRYAVRGTKIFISGGDSDLAENVVHMVLARVEGAPVGTKGLSLFIIPKLRVNDDGSLGGPNDVTVGALEHKMGIRGSSTCVLNFGDADGCIGELVGTVEHQGMPQMFKMMNGARIEVGIQGVAIAGAAYQSALDYARDRKQGSHYSQWKDAAAPRVAILEHPDVRRMLLDMKARVTGIRALIVKLAHHTDLAVALAGVDEKAAAYHQGQVDLLVPLVKAYSSDQAFRICEMAIQTYGGAGYIADYPVEQYCRDAKIGSIYEGTNHIQAMDLVGRKLAQADGANLRSFFKDVLGFVKESAKHAVVGPLVAELGAALEALQAATMQLVGWQREGKLALIQLAANRYLEMMSEVAVGWLLIDGARIADAARAALPDGAEGERAFYAGKLQAAAYFARNVLPRVKLGAELIARSDTSPLDIENDAFSTL